MYSTDVVSTNTNKLIWIIFRLYKTMNECNQITAVRVEFLNQTIKRKLFIPWIYFPITKFSSLMNKDNSHLFH